MPDRKQARRSNKDMSGRAAPLPTDQEDWLTSAPDAENTSAPLLEQARANPTTLTPRQVLQLQRTIGNHAVNNLISKNRGATVGARHVVPTMNIQREVDEAEDDTLVADHDADAGLETAIAREIESVPAGAVQRGLFSKGKGNVSQGPLSEVRQTTMAGITGMGVYRAITRGLELINGAREAGGEIFKGALTEFANLLNGMAIPGFVGLIKRIYDAITTYIGMKGLKASYDNLVAKEKNGVLDPHEVELKEASAHGFGKVKRRFYKAVYLVISSIVKVAANIITLVTGGTAAMASGLIAVGASVLEGIQTLYEKGKGFIKWLRNKRGNHRKQSADRIINAALLKKDENALRILIDLNAYSTIRNEKYAFKHGHGGVDTPETTEEMYNLLVAFDKTPDKYGSLTEYHDDVMKKLKSG